MSFEGRTVTLEAFAPNLTSPLLTGPQTAVVGPGEEVSDLAQFDNPSDSFLVVNGDFDVSADTITFTVDDNRFFGFADVEDFNGLVFTFDLGETQIVDVSLFDDAFEIPDANLFFNANTIFLDFDGLPFQNGDSGNVRVTFGTEDTSFIDTEDAIFTARLYAAAFGREPDQPGLNFWINAFDDVGRDGMASFFLESPEFQTLFGDPVALSNEDYLDVLYDNILGREGDEAGTIFWLDVLNQELKNRAEVLAFFVDSEENVENTPSFENVGLSTITNEWFLIV